MYQHHHISLLTENVAANKHFYTDVLGLRFIKNSVNQNNPHRRHIYYGDYVGTPGSVVTFFPVNFHGRQRVDGPSYFDGLAFNVSLESLDFWHHRLVNQFQIAVVQAPNTLIFQDTDNVPLRLQGVENPPRSRWTTNPKSDIPAQYQLLGIATTTLVVRNQAATEQFFEQMFGLSAIDHVITLNQYEHLLIKQSQTDASLKWGPGSVDHYALGVATSTQLDALWERAAQLGYQQEFRANRGYFESVYFREPSGLRIEVATNGPGFTLDESIADLGTTLSLPGEFETRRAEINDYFARHGLLD